jgi:anthranilate synthase
MCTPDTPTVEQPTNIPSFQHGHSDPESEEKETELKASALIDAIVREDEPVPQSKTPRGEEPVITSEKKQKKVLLVDHEDSFVHTLANYLRQTGKPNDPVQRPPNSPY